MVQRLYVVVVFTTCRFWDVLFFFYFYIPYRFLFAIDMAVAMAYYLFARCIVDVILIALLGCSHSLCLNRLLLQYNVDLGLILPLA